MCLAIPGLLTEKSEADGVLTGKVKFGGISRDVCMDFLPEAEVGNYVLVHVGFAISQIDAEEARKTYEYLEKTGLVEEELSAMRASSSAVVCPLTPGLVLTAKP